MTNHQLSNTRNRSRPLIAAVIGITLVACSGEQAETDSRPSPTTHSSGSSAVGGATSGPGIPDDLPEFEGSELEWQQALAGCLERAGFEMTVDESIPAAEPVDLADDQAEAYNQAFGACLNEVGEIKYEPLTDEQIADIYHRELATKMCLEGLGFDVEEPISEEQYVEEYYSEGGPSWYAYRDIPDREFAAAEEECPQP